MRLVKRMVVVAVEGACTVLDTIPSVRRKKGGLVVRWYGQYGCLHTNLAVRSYNLDKRWGTGIWKPDTRALDGDHE